jgi:predicted transcriptional regulator
MVTPVRSIRLDDDVYLRLLAMAELHHASVSDLVRDALKEYFERIERDATV